MTHVPCPPVKKKEKKSHQPFSNFAASSLSAPAPTKTAKREEKKQGRQRVTSDKNTCCSAVHIHHPFLSFFFLLSETDPSLTHTHKHAFTDLIGKFSWTFSGNLSWQSSSALCRHFVFAEEGPDGDASAAGTHHVWVDHRAQFCNSILPRESCQATLPAP